VSKRNIGLMIRQRWPRLWCPCLGLTSDSERHRDCARVRGATQSQSCQPPGGRSGELPRPKRRVQPAAPCQLTAKHGSSRLAAHPPLPRSLQPPPPPAAQRVCRQQRAPPSLPRVLLPTPHGTHSQRARGAGLEQR
jgi:hypothetical protein